MKTTLPNGIVLEGSKEEMLDFLKNETKQRERSPPKRDTSIKPYTYAGKLPKKSFGKNLKTILPYLNSNPETFSKEQVKHALNWTDKEFNHGAGWSLKKQVKKHTDYVWNGTSYAFIKKSDVYKTPIKTVKHSYMHNKHDWTTKGAKTSRFYRVSPSRARQIEDANITVEQAMKEDATETFRRHFANNRITVGVTFFHALADVLKENDEFRTRAFIRQFMDEEQYLSTFLPFILKYGKQFKERFSIEGNLAITLGGIRLK